MLLCESDIDWENVYNVGPDSSCTCKLIDMAHRVISIGLDYGYKKVDINVIEKEIQQTAGLNSQLFQDNFGYKPQYNLDLMIRGLYEMKGKL